MKLAAKPFTLAGLVGSGGSTFGGLTGLTYSPPPPGTAELGPTGLTFTNATEMGKFKGGICVNTQLNEEGKELLNKEKVAEGEWTKQGSKFGGPRGKAKGCVAVSWEKRIWNSNHWRGEIRYEWLYTKGNDTIVTYGLYSTNENAKIRWRTIYTNSRTKQSVWKNWHYDTRSKIPKNPVFPYKGGEYFGFNPDFNKICTMALCPGAPKEKLTGESKWTWIEGGGKQKFNDWTQSFRDIFNYLIMYSDNHLNNLSSLVNEEGTWTRR